jgi:hypothetical protein
MLNVRVVGWQSRVLQWPEYLRREIERSETAKEEDEKMF